MSDLGIGYDLINQHVNTFLITDNPFAVRCILTAKNGEIQGRGASMDPESLDVLKCLPNFIGLQISVDTGLPIIGDSAEASLNIDDITIGRPIKGWTIEFPLKDGIWRKFKIEACLEDRVIGTYRVQVSLFSNHDIGTRVLRQRSGRCL